MSKLNKFYTDEPTNFQGYYLNRDGQPVFDSLLIGNVELKAQTDGTVVVTDKVTGVVKTTLEVNRDSEQAITKVFGATIQEDAATAFQPSDIDTVIATDFNVGREQYQMQFDFLADSNRHTIAYRGKSTTGLDNVRVLVYCLTNEDPSGTDEANEFNELISGQWWMTKNHVWSTRKKREVIDERLRKQDTTYVSPFDLVPDVNEYVSIDVDVTFEQGKHYRILVCADNQFDLKGIDNVVPDPINGGTQFFLYTERTYRDFQRVTGVSTTIVFESSDTIDFERDGTNTTITADNGDSFNVNTIKAVQNSNGFIDINTIRGTKVLYQNINHENVTIAGVSAGIDISSVINALNALFTVTQGQLTTAITSPEVDSTGTATTNNNYTNVIDPVGDASFGLGSGSHGVVYTDDRINESGEYFTFLYNVGKELSRYRLV